MTTPDQSFEELLDALCMAAFDCGMHMNGPRYVQAYDDRKKAKESLNAAHSALKLAVRQAETSQRELLGVRNALQAEVEGLHRQIAAMDKLLRDFGLYTRP